MGLLQLTPWPSTPSPPPAPRQTGYPVRKGREKSSPVATERMCHAVTERSSGINTALHRRVATEQIHGNLLGLVV